MKNIGRYFTEAREERNLSLKRVAEELGYTPNQISNMEKGKRRDLILLLKLMEFYDIELDWLYQSFYVTKNQLDYIQNIKEQVHHHVKLHQYREIGKLLEKQWKNPAFKKVDPSFLSWHQGIYEFHHNKKDKELAFKLFEDATKHTSDKDFVRKFEIANSKGVILLESNDPEQACMLFQEQLNKIKPTKKTSLNPILTKVHIRILYNQAVGYYRQKDFLHSLHSCQYAIDLGTVHNNAYLQGELLYQLGLNLFYLAETKESIKNMRQGACYLERSKRYDLLALVQQKWAQLGLWNLLLD